MALVIVMKDTLMKINTQEVTLLVILDLSVAFDTVNYNILLTCTGKNNGFPFLDILGYLKNTIKIPNLAK